MAQSKDSPSRRTADEIKIDYDESRILGLLEPQILGVAYRLGIKLALLKVSMFSDSAKFAEQLGLEPGDEVLIAFPQQEYSAFRALTETLKMRGVIVYSFVSMRIPTDTFAFGVKKRNSIIA